MPETTHRDAEAERLTFALVGTRLGLWDWDMVTGTTIFNERWAEIVGYRLDELQPTTIDTWLRLANPDDLPMSEAAIAAHVRGDTPTYDVEVRMLHRDGHIVWVHDRGQVMTWNADGTPRRMVGTHDDITDRVEATARLRQAAAVFDTVSEGVLLSDAHGIVTDVNAAFTRLTGFPRAALVGTHAMAVTDPGVADDEARAMGAHHVTGLGSRDEISILHRDGTASPSLVTVSPIRDDAGAVTGYVTLIADLAAHVEAERATLDHATMVDHITELPNRRGFAGALAGRLAHRRRGDEGSAVLVIDLDRFKDVNDSYGTTVGDELLRRVALRLTTTAGPDDLVARLGSDEFALFAHAINRADEADLLARRIQDSLAPAMTVAPGVEVFVTACVGTCLVEPEGATADVALQRAAAALSDAKRAGPGSTRLHDDALTTVSRARLSLETRLRRSWEEQQFVVHYQPQVDVATERIVGAEALLRWPIPGGGQVPPGSFIPLAERIGLIDEIGAWVLDQACAQGMSWRHDGLPELTIAVNVAARQLARGTFADQVGSALAKHHLPPRLLELELTESALLETGDRTLDLLGALSSLGVRLSIDDFGTGYSSFAYLKRFPLDQLKVDRSFVADLENDRESLAIAAAIVGLGHTLGLSVLAEGVETPGQLAVLRSQGCDLFQGYLVSPALPPDAFADLVRATL